MVNSTSRADGLLYPVGLERAELSVRMEYFHGAMIKHYHFENTLRHAERLIQSGVLGTIILIVGPAGVGKSALCELLCDQINSDFFSRHPEDQFRIPAVGIEALAPLEGEPFDWHEFNLFLLELLQIPLAGLSVPALNKEILGRKFLVPQYDGGVSGVKRALRRRLISGIALRDPFLIFVDEAANMLRGKTRRSVDTQANVMRSLVNKAKSRLLLTGAYDLHDLTSMSGQLARRGRVIHMKSYSTKEREHFMSGLVALANSMPIKAKFDIAECADMLETGSTGCIGIVKSILLDVMALSEIEKSKITRELISRCMPTPDVVETLWREAFKGYYRVERKLHPDDGHRVGEGGRRSAGNEKAPRKAGNRGRVGQQKPKRHRMEV